MNKISLYGLSAVMAFGFAACDGYEEPNPAPQSNAQSAIINANDVTFAYVLGTEVYDLEALSANDEQLVVATVTTDSLPDNYTFGVTTTATTTYTWVNDGQDESKTVTFDVPTTVTLASEEGVKPRVYNVTVDPNVLSGLYDSKVTHNPANATLTLSSNLNTEFVSGGAVVETASVGNPADKKVSSAFTIAPIEKYQLEDEYYLIPGGDFSQAIKLTHIIDNAGQDVYANTRFSVITECDGNFEWQIVPASVKAAGSISDKNYAVWGPNEDSKSLASGQLIAKKGDVTPAEGDFKEEGTYQMTFDFAAGTFEFIPAISTLWVNGNHCGWGFANAPTIITDNYINFWGYAFLNGEYKFAGQPDWNPFNWGAGAEAGTLKAGGDNLNVANAGMYYLEVNLSDLTYNASIVTTYGVIGDFNGWGESVNLTPNDDYTIWTGKATLTEGGAWKFRANDDWVINLGGDLDNLVPGGDNIIYNGPTKEVTITLDLTQYPYFATVE